MAKAKLDENGKVQIPLEALKKLGLKSGAEFELKQDDGVLVLKPILPEKSRVKSSPLSASEKNGNRRKRKRIRWADNTDL
jgi:bifunctional DNA-binding transcriptional regulator/antitoxin component of YhaV-PrlF toxin-antitoxin module